MYSELFDKQLSFTGVISHDFLFPTIPLDPSIINVVLFQYIEFYKSQNARSKIIWLSPSSCPTLPLIDSIKYLEKEGYNTDSLNNIEFYKLPSYQKTLSEQRQNIESLIKQLERLKKSYRNCLIVIDDMDMMLKSDDPGKIKIDQAFGLIFNTLRNSKISIIYHSPAISSDFVTSTGDRKIHPRWIHSIVDNAGSHQIKVIFHWVVRPPRSAKLKTEERIGNYTLIRYNGIPKKEKIVIDKDDLIITDLGEGLKPKYIPFKSKRIKAQLPELILNSPKYQSSKYIPEKTDIQVDLFRVSKSKSKTVRKYKPRRSKSSNSLWIMKYTCKLKSVQSTNPMTKSFIADIELIRTADFDEYYNRDELHELQKKYMNVLGLSENQIFEILGYFELNSEYLGQDWIVAIVSTFIYWWKCFRSDQHLDNRELIIELISRVISNKIVNSWIIGENYYDGKKAATLAKKLAKSISLSDHRFNFPVDQVNKIIGEKPKGKIRIMTHKIRALDNVIYSIIDLSIPKLGYYSLRSTMKMDSKLADEFLTYEIDEFFEETYQTIESDVNTSVWVESFVIVNMKKEYNENTLKTLFTEMEIIYNEELYRITQFEGGFTWTKLDYLDID